MSEHTSDLAGMLEQCTRELQASEARLRNLITKNADGIIIVDRDGIVQFVNPAAESLFNRPAAELIGSLFGFPVVVGETTEMDVLRAGGKIAVVEMRVVETEWEGALAFLASLRDITDRKRAEDARAQLIREQAARAEAEEASRMKDEFLATVSHELRTPLNAMLGWARLVRSGQLGQADTERALETIERNAKLQAQIIEDLLDVSRIITGKLCLNTRFCELAAIIEAAVEAMRPAARAKALHLKVALDDQLGPVLLDPDRMQQIIWNLLSNAIKFTPSGGQVEIRLERAGTDALISVTDTGMGISSEFLPYVFDRFRQADGSSTRKHGGLGLGLAIVKHLVELHDGSIAVESLGAGHGTTFSVRFPLTATEREAEVRADPLGQPLTEPHSIINQAALSGVRVLMVDDEADARELISFILLQSGAEVRAVVTASEAMQEFLIWQPDIIISDIGMPGQDGYALIRQLRMLEAQRGRERKTPAVALTAYARGEERAQALAAGYQVHLAKPVEPAHLVSVITSLTKAVGQAQQGEA